MARWGRQSKIQVANTHLRDCCIQRTVMHKQNSFQITSRAVQGWTKTDFWLFFFTNLFRHFWIVLIRICGIKWKSVKKFAETFNLGKVSSSRHTQMFCEFPNECYRVYNNTNRTNTHSKHSIMNFHFMYTRYAQLYNKFGVEHLRHFLLIP